MSSKALRLVVSFAASDKLSGPMKKIIGLGEKGSEKLARMKREARDMERELRGVQGELKRSTGNVTQLMNRERDLASRIERANHLMERQANLNANRARMQAVQDHTGRIGTAATAAVTVPAVIFAKGAIQKAIDNEELQSAFNITFGPQSAAMNEWAAQTARQLGRTRTELKKSANAFGIFFNQVTPDQAKAAEMSKTFSVLAQDLASFFNTDEGTALQKLRSGLAGESEPLRDFGVFLTEATVKQKAYQMGLAKTGADLTEQQKIQARYALILEKTKNAQGDVLRTSDSTANRLRAANAAWTDLQITVGEKLIPRLNPLIEKIGGVLDAFSKLSPETQDWIVTAGVAAAVFGPIMLGVSGLAAGIKTVLGPLSLLKAGFDGFRTAQQAGKFAKIGSALASAGKTALTAGSQFVVAGARYTAMAARFVVGKIAAVAPVLMAAGRAALTMGWGFLKAGIMMMANPIVLIITAIVAAVALAGYLIYKNWDTIKAAFWTGVAALGQAWEWIKVKFNAGIDWFKALPGRMMSIGKNIINGLVDGILAAPGKVWNALKNIVLGGVDKVKALLGIKSPSRVFMALGGYVADGMAIGINRGKGAAIGAAKAMATGVAGAGMASASMAMTPMATTSPGGTGISASPAFHIGQITISVLAAPGQSPQDIGQAVLDAFEQRASKAAASNRSSFSDT